MRVDLEARPAREEYGDFYAAYIAGVPDGDIRETLERESAVAAAFYAAIPETRSGFAYAPGKWTVGEVVGHIADCERVFAYRALRFGRGDGTPLAGFDQDPWVEASHASSRPWRDLVADFTVVRAATLQLMRSFSPEDWARSGEACDVQVTVRALVWILTGHELHHRRILAERYGVGKPEA